MCWHDRKFLITQGGMRVKERKKYRVTRRPIE
jgi:hypothetical protein